MLNCGYVVTAEDRAKGVEVARANREANKKIFKQSYDCENLWLELAKAKGVRLSQHKAPTAHALGKFAKLLGIPEGEWQEALFGSYYTNSVKKAIEKHNNKLPEGQKESLRAMQGYILEAFA